MVKDYGGGNECPRLREEPQAKRRMGNCPACSYMLHRQEMTLGSLSLTSLVGQNWHDNSSRSSGCSWFAAFMERYKKGLGIERRRWMTEKW